jgi:hypothetical protein
LVFESLVSFLGEIDLSRAREIDRNAGRASNAEKSLLGN